MAGLYRFEQYKSRREILKAEEKLITEGLTWFNARKTWFSEAKNARDVWKYRHLGKHVSIFELFCARLPNLCFKLAVRLIQRGIL